MFYASMWFDSETFCRVYATLLYFAGFLSLQGPRPSALVIERTLDNGKTWQPTLYMATNCQKAFPSVPTRVPLAMDQTYCYTLPPTDTNPYKDHTVREKLLLFHLHFCQMMMFPLRFFFIHLHISTSLNTSFNPVTEQKKFCFLFLFLFIYI